MRPVRHSRMSHANFPVILPDPNWHLRPVRVPCSIFSFPRVRFPRVRSANSQQLRWMDGLTTLDTFVESYVQRATYSYPPYSLQWLFHFRFLFPLHRFVYCNCMIRCVYDALSLFPSIKIFGFLLIGLPIWAVIPSVPSLISSFLVFLPSQVILTSQPSRLSLFRSMSSIPVRPIR
jgi:hypothetical protein